MAMKPNGRLCVIREQIIEDASGLTFQFEVTNGFHHGQPVEETVLRIFGSSLPCGNRQIIFGPDGDNVGSGTFTRDLCRPAWLEELEP